MEHTNFEHRGSIYDLSHLDSFDWEYTATATSKRPERTYKIQVIFSIHTFTKGLPKTEEPEQDLIYETPREKRLFCFIRYELSKKLKDIIYQLGERKCFHTHHGNFFTIELLDENGERQDYEIYFQASRASEKGWLNLYVQSAYVRDPEHKQ